MAKNSDFRVGDHIIVIKPCDYEGERGVVTKITDDRVYIQLDDEYEPLDDSFYDEDLNWDYEMLQETAAKRYPKGTVFRFEEVDSWRTAYDPKQFHVPNEGTLFAEPGNGVLFRHGAWAKVKGEDASKHISKFKVGDVVHLIESKKGVSPGPQIITEVLPDRYYHINGMKGQDWMGEFHEDWFTLLKFKVGDIVIGNAKADQYNITTEGWKGRVIGVTDDYFTVVGLDGGSEYAVEYDCFDLFVEPMPADEKIRTPQKFKLGEIVQVCGSHQCNGYGYMQPDDRLEPVKGVAHRIEKIISITWSDERQEWYYGSKDMSGTVAEHALSLHETPKTPESPKTPLRFKNGDRVAIRPDSQYLKQGMKDGVYLHGVVTDTNSYDRDSYFYLVRWSNDEEYNYREQDLRPWVDQLLELRAKEPLIFVDSTPYLIDESPARLVTKTEETAVKMLPFTRI